MSKITGWEDVQRVPEKVLAMYTAVLQLIEEGTDVANIRVSSITERAGIGKGTAYEYFDTKEEIVACAVLYYMQQLFGRLEQDLLERPDFAGQLDFLLGEMAKKDGRKHCFLRFVHLLTDQSELSKMIRDKMEHADFAPYRPVNVFQKVLKTGVERGQLKADLPVEYMVYSLFSHLLAYLMMVTEEENIPLPNEQIRRYVKLGILRELKA